MNRKSPSAKTVAKPPHKFSRITKVEAHEVIVPAKEGYVDSPAYGPWVRWDLMPIVLLEVHTDDGLVGLGEIGRGTTLASVEPWLKQLPGVVLSLPHVRCLPDSWLPKPTGLELLTYHPLPVWQSPSPAMMAMDIAIHDLAAKRQGVRVVDLLGGPCRERVTCDYWCSRQTPDDLVKVVRRAKKAGLTGLKMKSKRGDPVIEQVAAVKQEGGKEFHLTIDPMTQWLSPHEALPVLRDLEKYAHNLRIEDPFPHECPDFWLRARMVTSVPLVCHCHTMERLRLAIRERYCDGFNVGYGFSDFLTMAHAVEVAGYSCWHGSAIEMGVTQLAHLHACAAARACEFPSDLCSGVIREHTLITWDWPYKNGSLPIPDGPGLGVDLDRNAVEKYKKNGKVFA